MRIWTEILWVRTIGESEFVSHVFGVVHAPLYTKNFRSAREAKQQSRT